MRVFHWLAAVLVALAYVSERLDWMDWHVRIGEALLALGLFRVLWGCFGSETARFRRFLAAPRAAWHHLRELRRREPDLQAGHNPAGGWMVLLLLALLLGETLSGLYVNNDVADNGPWTAAMPAWIADAITRLHTLLWDALVAAVALHLLAIAAYAVFKGQNLVRPMLTGRKLLPPSIAAPYLAPLRRALVLLGLGVGIVILLARYL